MPLALDRRRLLQLQAYAGNRATIAALRRGPVVQRVLDSGQAATIAARLHDAMSRALARRGQGQVRPS